MVINPQFEKAFPFNGGLAVVQMGGKAGYSDKTGKIVMESQFDGLGPYSENLAAIRSHGK